MPLSKKSLGSTVNHIGFNGEARANCRLGLLGSTVVLESPTLGGLLGSTVRHLYKLPRSGVYLSAPSTP